MSNLTSHGRTHWKNPNLLVKVVCHQGIILLVNKMFVLIIMNIKACEACKSQTLIKDEKKPVLLLLQYSLLLIFILPYSSLASFSIIRCSFPSHFSFHQHSKLENHHMFFQCFIAKATDMRRHFIISWLLTLHFPSQHSPHIFPATCSEESLPETEQFSFTKAAGQHAMVRHNPS